MKKLLWVFTKKSTFVEKDIQLLSDEFFINEFHFVNFPKYKTIGSLFKLFFHLLIHKYDLIVCQFAGYQSFIPAIFYKLFKSKLLIIVGGTDCASIPEINYGNFNKKMLSFVTKFSLKNCSYISAVDESLIYQKYEYDSKYSNQGIKYFIPDIKTPMNVIYNGYNAEKWKCSINQLKEKNTFLTVAAGSDIVTLKRKGIDLIFEIVDYFPECKFIIIGLPDNFSLLRMKKNIITVPFLENKKLIEYYCKSEFYFQLSLMEGFPNALCEAMLCGCIPIVSNVAAMPKIVGNSGFILMKRDKKMLIEIITTALNSDKKSLSLKARKQIENNYTEDKRKKELSKLINDLVNS